MDAHLAPHYLQATNSQLVQDYRRSAYQSGFQDPKFCMQILMKAVDAKVASLICELGLCYWLPSQAKNTGLELDEEEALRWFRRSAELGYGKAFSYIGKVTAQNGDIPAAMAAWERAAQPCNCCASRPCLHGTFDFS